MYYPNSIEEMCYEEEHIQAVLEEVKVNFKDYFTEFIKSGAESVVTADLFESISGKLGLENIKVGGKDVDYKKSFVNIIKTSIENFEKDRDNYLDLMDVETLEEHEDDPSNFKNVALKNECPIIRTTLHNKRAKELDRYRAEFKRSNPNELLNVVTNLALFAEEYFEEVYNKEDYDFITGIEVLEMSLLDTESYIVYGVIGGGIKSHLLYKTNPEVFPGRSREALWSLWYLTSKKTFGCIEDSEFLNINVKKCTTQQNFFYPYELFSFYAYHIYLLLKAKAKKYHVHIDEHYRYVIVDSFLSFVAQQHNDEIRFLQSQAREDGYGYY